MSSVATFSLSLVSSPFFMCSDSKSLVADNLATMAMVPGKDRVSRPSVLKQINISLNTALMEVSSTPVLWNSDTITFNRNCSYFDQLLMATILGLENISK